MMCTSQKQWQEKGKTNTNCLSKVAPQNKRMEGLFTSSGRSQGWRLQGFRHGKSEGNTHGATGGGRRWGVATAPSLPHWHWLEVPVRRGGCYVWRRVGACGEVDTLLSYCI